jgi:hypothetical protein
MTTEKGRNFGVTVIPDSYTSFSGHPTQFCFEFVDPRLPVTFEGFFHFRGNRMTIFNNNNLLVASWSLNWEKVDSADGVTPLGCAAWIRFLLLETYYGMST